MTEFEQADKNGDGAIDKAEWEAMKFEFERKRLEDEDADRDLRREQEAKRYEQQARMAWVAIWCMVVAYPLLIVASSIASADRAVDALSGMAAVFFPSVSIIVGAFYGFTNMKKSEEKSK